MPVKKKAVVKKPKVKLVDSINRKYNDKQLIDIMRRSLASSRFTKTAIDGIEGIVKVLLPYYMPTYDFGERSEEEIETTVEEVPLPPIQPLDRQYGNSIPLSELGKNTLDKMMSERLLGYTVKKGFSKRTYLFLGGLIGWTLVGVTICIMTLIGI